MVRPGPAWPWSDARKSGRDGRGGAHNPMGARALYLYACGKDTLYRIHGTNQPGWIGHAISSSCIRLTNEDVIDLYSRVKMGATVVVL
jgi:lipoprotein-anchoring transpeptidase ErfK/SrfK